MAETSDLKWRVTEIATCPICLEDFKNSKMLPCVHSFCLECLQGYCKVKSAGDDVACPVCRTEFEIPEAGLEELPRNFFVHNLIDARDASSQEAEEVLCEVCVLVNDEDDGEIPPATMYCADCNQKLCRRCSKSCRGKTRGGPHRVRSLGAELSAELIQQRGSYCDQHKDEKQKLYCHDCEINVCLMCHVVNHIGHMCADIGKVADEFIKLFDSDVSSVSSRIGEFHAAMAQVEAEHTTFMSTVDENGTLVQQRGEAVNQITDKQVSQLMQELQTVKSDGMKEASNRSEELKLALTSLGSFKIYLAELMTKGSPCDITHAAKSIRSRTSELLQTYVVPAEYHTPCISFTPMNIDELANGGQNFIGRISLQNTSSDGSGSDELHFQTVHERALEQELKQSVDRDQQLKDETIRLQQQLNQSQTETASYQSELQQHDQKIEDDLKATAEREERLQADLKKASDTEKNLLRQMTELQLQLQQSAARQKTLEETLKSFQEIYYSKLVVSVVHTLRGDKNSVKGVTSLGDELFVLRSAMRRPSRHNHQQPSLCVSSTTDFAESPDFDVPEMSEPSDIASCERKKCLYIPDSGSKCMHSIHFKGVATVTSYRWSLPKPPRTLSVTLDNNVLVVCEDSLLEVNSDTGQCVRQISLQSDMSLRHGVQLTTGQFVVCYTGVRYPGLHGVCLVDVDGKVSQSRRYVGQLNYPCHLAVDKDSQFIFVADGHTCKVVLLTPTLEFVRYVTDTLPDKPRRLHFDPLTRHLYVGLCNGNVVVLQL